MEVTIERLGREGDGMAGALRPPFALPGERWRVSADAGADLVDAAAERVARRCRHFGSCGGCALQHASDAFLDQWKVETIVRALGAQDPAASLRPIVTVPPRSRRRAALVGRRTRSSVLVGFHVRHSETVVGVTECWVVRPEILAALPALARLTTLGASRSSALRLTVTAGPAGLDVHVAGGRPLDAELPQRLAELSREVDLARLSWARPPDRRGLLRPASFARDARLLVEGGFRLDWVQPVDQFRWSGHVELAAAFSR